MFSITKEAEVYMAELFEQPNYPKPVQIPKTRLKVVV